MKQTQQTLLAATVLGCALMAGCAGRPPVEQSIATLPLDSGSLRMTLRVDEAGSVDLAEHPPLRGRIAAGPILTEEGSQVDSLQVLLHQGRYYLTAEGFRNVWELVPESGTTRATYRPIPVSSEPLSGVRMSRYGPAGRACVRLDVDGSGPWFVNNDGELDDHCG